MKKILFIFLMLLTINVKAYDNKIIKIDIDDTYKLELEKTDALRWTKDNSYVAITIGSNEEKKYDVKTFKDEDIKKQKEYLEKGINEGISKFNISAVVSDILKKNNDKYYFLEYDIYYPSKKVTGYDMYQKGRMYTTNNYIVTIIYSSDKKLDKTKEYENILNSLEILDNKEVVPNRINWLFTVIVTGVTLGIIGGVISIKKTVKK